jgi:hypothetical protein
VAAGLKSRPRSYPIEADYALLLSRRECEPREGAKACREGVPEFSSVPRGTVPGRAKALRAAAAYADCRKKFLLSVPLAIWR